MIDGEERGVKSGEWEKGGGTRARMESKSSERDLFWKGRRLVVWGGEGGRGG